MHGIKELIKSPTRVTCSTSTLIDHILASFPSAVSQKGVTDVGMLIITLFSTQERKISHLKTGSSRSFKN